MTNGVKNPVTTGRVNAHRVNVESGYCISCRQRITIGTPKNADTWPARLHSMPLTEEQVDLLLVGAAEFRDLCEEAGEYADAVAFMDWVRVDALALVVNFTVSNEATLDRARGVA